MRVAELFVFKWTSMWINRLWIQYLFFLIEFIFHSFFFSPNRFSSSMKIHTNKPTLYTQSNGIPIIFPYNHRSHQSESRWPFLDHQTYLRDDFILSSLMAWNMKHSQNYLIEALYMWHYFHPHGGHHYYQWFIGWEQGVCVLESDPFWWTVVNVNGQRLAIGGNGTRECA